MQLGTSAAASFRRHMDGFALGALTVCIAALAALLMVPRAVEPRELPLPQVDRNEEARLNELCEERARAATLRPLPIAVRAVGEALRSYGRAEADKRDEALAELRAELRARTTRAYAEHGAEPLLALRALQTELFLAALAAPPATRPAHTELLELGGAFHRTARAQGWISETGRLQLDRAEQRLLFRTRWTELTGLSQTPEFRPSLNERRAHYRLLLARSLQSQRTLGAAERYVAQLARLDPDYPAELAAGILAYRKREWARAVAALRAHLAGPKRGIWYLRARNHLAGALENARDR